MGKRGRKPQPTTLKVLRGNPGRRPLNKDEPRPELKAPRCPPELGGLARKEWNRVVPQLKILGLVTLIDRAALAAYCINWERWILAEDQIRKNGMIYMQGREVDKETGEVLKVGYPAQNPYLAIANRAQKEMKAFLVEFGMTPSSRTGLSSKGYPMPEDDRNPWEKF